MNIDRIVPASKQHGILRGPDWLQASARVAGVGVYRSSIWPNKIVVARSGYLGCAVASAQVDAERLLLIGGWSTRLSLLAEDDCLDVAIDGDTMDLCSVSDRRRSTLILGLSSEQLSSELVSISTDFAVTSARFRLDCQPSLIPCLVGAVHLFCAMTAEHRSRRAG